MNPTKPQRKEMSQFLAGIEPDLWRVNKIISAELGYLEATLTVGMGTLGGWKFLKIFAHGAIDYAILPKDPATIEGGPPIKFSTDDSGFSSALQYVPGGDGERFNPPKRYQLLELDTTWIIAEQFEVELLEPTMTVGVKGEAAIKERRP